jgi:photosystem II stability/assembly factor-like uncharacterized protein
MSRSRVFSWLIPAAVALFLSASPVSAGHNVWTSQGPEGGNTQALVVTRGQPSVAYAGVLQGVFKSVDGGRTWRSVSQAIRPQILSLAGDPGDPETLYAGTTPNADTPLGGVFKTSDGGRTWRHLSLGNQIVTALAISPAQRATVWAGTTGGLYVSRDAGASWSFVAGVPRAFIWALAADPRRGRIVYASSQRGLFKTVNGGAGWRRIDAEFGGTTGPQAIAIDPVHSERIYIGGQFYSGVARSADGGITWQRTETILSPYEVRALAVDPVSSAVYAAAEGSPGHIYKSLDGGASWRPAGRGLPRTLILALAVDPTHRSDLYAGTLAGVWKSADRGASWAPANRGIRQTSVRDVAVDPSTPGTVYATADYSGVFKSTDRGASWQLLGGPDGGLDGSLVTAVAAEPRPSSPAILYAGTDLGIFRSTNGGGSWRFLVGGPAGGINDLALSPGVLYAATNAGAFRSADHGETWTLIWPGSGTDGTVRRIAVSPVRPSDVYLTAPSGIYASSDGGETWTQGNLTLSPIAVAVDPLRPSIVYTSLGGGELFKSFDSGLTWQAAGSVQPAATITDLAIDPLHPDTLYAGTYLGFYRSLDGGASWAPFLNSDGSGPTKVQAVALDARGRLTLYAGTGENGVFDRTSN